MVWIIGIVCFLVGAGLGALLFKTLRSDAVKVKELEGRLQQLSGEHENYKSNVHSHFNGTARLLNDMTESYRNVYQHLANGAQALCPDYISSQLSLNTEARALLDREPPEGAASPPGISEVPEPPLDYAARTEPGQKGSLDEDYGIDKPEKY
jgi:uncharacterized protein